MMMMDPTGANGNLQAAGGYGPPGGGGYGGPPGGGGGYGGPPGGGGGYGGPPGGGGYGGPPGGGPPGYGGPPGGGPPGGGGYGGPPGGGPPGYGGPPGGPMGGPPGGGFGGPGGFGPPGGGFPPPGGPMMPGTGGDLNMTMPMVINGVGFFLCSPSCLASILFLVGFIFAIQGNSMKNQGDIAGATAKRKTSMLMAYIGLGLGLLGWIFIIISQAMR